MEKKRIKGGGQTMGAGYGAHTVRMKFYHDFSVLPVPQTFPSLTSPKHAHVVRVPDRKAVFHYVLYGGYEVLAIY